MKFVDEFRDPAAARALVQSITELARDDEFKFMEVCGGHTHTIYRHGIEHLLPTNVELVHGPGCPVCVIPMGRVDDAMWLAEQPDVIFTTFGDMMRVPGSKGSLLEANARGCDVRFVYSPLDALKIAIDNPAKQIVYFAVGFETTAPSTAVTLVRAKELDVKNFSVFCNHVTIVPPIKAILDSPDLRLSGFLGPGHVSTVVGNRPYRFVPDVYGKPIVVAGFEPLDILASVHMLLSQIRDGRCEVENQYSRVVRDEGNPAAIALLGEVFELRPHFEWRGLGFISQSALKLNGRYAQFDAEVRYDMPGIRVADPKACQCGEVLKGVIKP
ncbi:MAG: hydrogenase formation protein HypD, partial [Actinomycetota bacterium]|nr:hydrogenase formation protein HypD [Actinomycetota bacterium]